ncbi:MAG TPA: DEAD/DEAH box helicase [Bryobacteraceae bacterium]|nr:DEAD/DEAH box helicase [Bryobacteraceae bacterium]
MGLVLSGFDPLVAEWFSARFGNATEPQLRGWPEIRAGNDVLISAPTGSGKTLAAFLVAIDALVRRAREGPLPDQTEVVYVSPLKALSNDVHKNLEVPLAEIRALAEERGIALAPIRTALRTGDTPQWERQQMTKSRPHILVTTPESLYILLTAAKPREMLGRVRTLIVDEIHAVADDKRGSHLSLTLARLDRLVEQSGCPKPQRIGLSATVKPIEEVASFLSDAARIVNVGHRREMDLAVEVPRDELGPVVSNEMWGEIYDRVAALIRENRTTLVFVNTRRLAERMAHHLAERLGEGAVLPHHGSLSRALRMDAERQLKNGELRAVVATASLELGIDIGTVDLVVQIGSPRSIAVALQRVGRAGHWVGAMPKGRIFATTRDELVECAAVVRAIKRGELDRLEMPHNALDILAQQMVAACAAEDFGEDELFDLVRRAWSYRTLERRDFDAVLEVLSEGISTSRGRAGAYLHRDAVNRRLRGRRGARLTAITSGGAIPETAQYLVVEEPEGRTVGTLDEDFAVESLAGDVFLLGTTSWRIKRVEQGRVRVENAHGAAPGLPFWLGEAPGRTDELSREVARLREDLYRDCSASPAYAGGSAMSTHSGAAACCPAVGERDLDHECGWQQECGLDRLGAEQLLEYVRAGRAALGAMPSTERVVAERFFDEGGGMQLVIHAPFGARINRAWGLALRKRFCRSFNFELQAAATDNGIVISLGEQHSFALEIVFEFLRPETVEPVLTQAMLVAPMFGARWRWNATRALAIPRYTGGRKVPPPIQRMKADDLMAAVFPDQAACPENLEGDVRIPDHPLVKETIENCLFEAMDLNGLREVLRRIGDRRIETVAIDTPEASPFSHEILNANPYAFLDDAPLEERRARAVQLRSTLRTDFAEGAGALDPAAIAQVAEEAWPPMRDADELHEALLSLCVLPVDSAICHPVGRLPMATACPTSDEGLEALAATGRAAVLSVKERPFAVAAERLELVRRVYPDGAIEPTIVAPPSNRTIPESEEGCAAEILRGWFECSGPVSGQALARDLAMPHDLVEQALAQLEAEGQILRGQFTGGGEVEWCHRRLLARIHRLTIGRLRREIEPVTTTEFFAFLRRWQHLSAGSQLHGVDGTLEIVRQLQGCEFGAADWESEVLPRRVAGYRPEYLDQLCLAGEVAWGRVSPHPAFERLAMATEGDAPHRSPRVRPTRVAPLAIFLRDDAGWLLAGPGGAEDASVAESLSHPARDVLAVLEHRGASFFADLTRATGRLASEVEDALWELVTAGLATADGFENLRALLDPKRRRGEGKGRSARPRHAPGRWTLLRHTAAADGRNVETFARQLLARWGILFHDAAVREPLAPAWRDLLVELRRMELRGEIRGGRFVAAFMGEQFALPEAVDLLRSVRRTGTDGDAAMPVGPGPWAALEQRAIHAAN